MSILTPYSKRQTGTWLASVLWRFFINERVYLKLRLVVNVDRTIAMLPSHLSAWTKIPGSVLGFPLSSETHPEEAVSEVVGVGSAPDRGSVEST